MKTVFIVGCSRSGTTWMQLLLYQHPAVATVQETHLFDWYISPFYEIFKRDSSNVGKRKVGLSEIISQNEFDEFVSSIIEKTLFKIKKVKNNAEVIVEKTPEHVRFYRLICRFIPDAYFIHIIRDPRSVVSSMLHAKKLWGSATAPAGGVISASKRWVSDVNSGLSIKGHTPNYLQIFYENLVHNGKDELRRALDFIGLDYDEDMLKIMINSCSISNLKNKTMSNSPWSLSNEPKNFYRKGKTASWKEELSPSQINQVEYISKDLMTLFGYQFFTHIKNKPQKLIIFELFDNLIKLVYRRLPESIIEYARFSLSLRGRTNS